MKYDQVYWQNRNLEDKDYWMTLQWIEFLNPTKVFDYGCGNGKHVHCFRYYGIEAYGEDISEYAIQNPIGLAKDNIFLIHLPLEGHKSTLEATPFAKGFSKFDLVTCIDVLEHIPEQDAIETIKYLYKLSSKYILVSICFPEDPNFEKDDTHITRQPRVWWADQFSKLGLVEVALPTGWLFRPQFMLWEKCGKNG